MPLTDIKVRNAKPKDRPYNLTDEKGLYIEIRPSGSKFWRYRFWVTPTKDGRYTIGEYPYVSLAEARKEAEWARQQVKKGLNPTAVKKSNKKLLDEDRLNTFKSISIEWLERKEKTLNESTIRIYRSFLFNNCYPIFGDKPIKDITSRDILVVLKRIESNGSPSSAVKVRMICSSIFRYAVSTLRAEFDPASALLGSIITPKTNHSRCLSREEIKLYFERLEKSKSTSVVKLFLKILPFLFVRQSELRGALWSEIDMENKTWIISEDRMKMGKLHIVPLSDYVLSLMTDSRRYTKSENIDLVFQGTNGGKISKSTPNRAIENLGFKSGDITCHDFRATASTMLYEMGFRSELIEKQLSHSETNKSIAAYNHAEYMRERRDMMAEWTNVLLEIINS
ncbi:tyrosine-type recombinase/integrase [Xenorhabdus sp. SF857]|uniref:tyrosine-type recombinase/integrase n=1 Tax=Xenorhabdus bakwenae TaxID=3026967 RepID=UPI00255830AD|nr:integrase arm-type DNA-binding domain-containing protein [Xenorhabdus sp. SF857]WFQ80472.1 tyrosine-type recombinase/integrase [Xenorhabdus sp. SF857]